MRISWRVTTRGLLLAAAALALHVYSLSSAGYGGGAEYRMRQFMFMMLTLLLLVLAYLYPALHAVRRRSAEKWRVLALNGCGLILGGAGIISVDFALFGALAALACWAAALYLAARQPDVKSWGISESNRGRADADDPVWMDTLKGFDWAALGGEASECELEGIEMIRGSAAKHGGEAVAASVSAQHDKGRAGYFDGALDLYWLGRAGVREAIPLMLKSLESSSDDMRRYAAWGLAHLGEQAGFDAIEAVLYGTATPDPERDDFDWYDCLDEIDDERARALLAKYRDRGRAGA